MLTIQSRFQLVMGIVTAVMIVATAASAVHLSRAHVAPDGIATGIAVADIGDMMAAVGDLRRALTVEGHPASGVERSRNIDALRSRLGDMAVGEVEPTRQSAEEQALRGVLGGALLDLKLMSLDDGDASRALVSSALGDVEMALQALSHASTSHLRATALDDLRSTDAALRLHLALLASTVVVILGLLLVTLRRQWAQHRLARHDALTGLGNRLGFSETLNRWILDPDPGNEVGLILLDLDLFKNINDSLGHAAGDRLLKAVAARLDRLAGPDVHIARLGGDEFALALASRRAHRAVETAVEKIRGLVLEPLDLDGTPVTVGMSIGTSVTPLGLYDAQTLLKHADIALYAAKSGGRGRSRNFTPRMERELRERRALEDDLRRGIADGQVDVHFQPILDLASRQIVSCEALARWDRPGHGLVSPAVFIPVAEEIGLIKDMGASVLRRACAAARDWPQFVRVSVNVSAHQVDDTLLDVVRDALAGAGLEASRLELEITETVFVKDGAAVASILSDLRGLGVQIALDDFGTGFSSLSYLQRFAIDRIKIDQSFVRKLADSPESAAIVESICTLAGKLGLSTTGEGIENEANASQLSLLGCREGQGYLFDRPMPVAACTAKLLAVARFSEAA